MSLRMKLQLPIVLLIILMCAAIGSISYLESASSLREALVGNMRGQAQALARAIGIVARDAVDDIGRIAQNSDINAFYGSARSQAESAAMSEALQVILDGQPNFFRISLLDISGVTLASSSQAAIGQNFSDRDYFKAAMQGERYISQPFISRVNQGKAVLAVSAPVRRSGRTVGVAYCIVPLDAMETNMVNPISLGTTGYAFVLGANGLIAIHREKEWVGNSDLKSAPYYKEMAGSEAMEGIKEFTGNKGSRVFNYYAREKFSRLTAVIQADYDDVFSDLDELRNEVLLLSLSSILGGALLLFFLLRPILRDINAGTRFAGRIASGDLSGALDIRRNDELGRLAEALRAVPVILKQITDEYLKLERGIENGALNREGEVALFSGDFAELVRGTNSILLRFRMLLEHIPTPIAVLNKEGLAEYLNAAARELAGDDYAGKSCRQLFAREDEGGEKDALLLATRGLRPARGETSAHPRGKALEISYAAIPMLNKNGELSSILLLLNDLTEIKATQNNIMRLAGSAADIARRVAASSEELSAQVEEVSRGAETQRARVESTASAMTEMNATVLEVAKNAGQAAEEGEITKGKARDGASLVQQVAEAMEKLNSVASALQSNMRDLDKQAENIGGVMNVISDIADQTNLLALNAAIEAARAGEAGRGFAVVADEVRKLAEKTMSATREVGDNITGIQQATRSNSTEVNSAAVAIAEVSRLAEAAGLSLTEIVSLASSSSDVVSSIATAAEEQSATSEEINRALEEISGIVARTGEGMVQAAGAVRELSRMAQELDETMAGLKA